VCFRKLHQKPHQKPHQKKPRMFQPLWFQNPKNFSVPTFSGLGFRLRQPSSSINPFEVLTLCVSSHRGVGLSGPHPTQIWPARSRTRPWVVARPNLPRAQKTIGAPARPVNCGVDPARICVGRAAIAASSLPPRVPCAPAAACLDACMRQERGKEGEASGYGEMIGNGGIQFSCECGLV